MKHFFNFIFLIISVVAISSCGKRNKPAEGVAPSVEEQQGQGYLNFGIGSILSIDAEQRLIFEIIKYGKNNSQQYSFNLNFKNQTFSSSIFAVPLLIVENNIAMTCLEFADLKCTTYELISTLFDNLPIYLKIGKMETLQVESEIKSIKNIYNMQFPVELLFPINNQQNSWRISNFGLFVPTTSDDMFPISKIDISAEYNFFDNNNNKIKVSNKFGLSAQIENFQNYIFFQRAVSFNPEIKITDTFINKFDNTEEKRSWILKFIF